MVATKLSSIELYQGSDHGKHEYVLLAMTCNKFQDIPRNFCITNGEKGEFGKVWRCLPFICKELLTRSMKVEPPKRGSTKPL
jgi:hypothetical protein